MHTLDLLVLGGYFLVMIVIGVIASRRIHAQEDFFLGGRGFGKLLQTFAAFGAGTGSSDPVNTGRTTFTSGFSGMWSVMYWLFVTPFYWITGVWYRRMRHLTLGDWFVERYESRALGAAYAVFGIIFMMVYGSMLFSAIGKVAAPILDADTVVIFGSSVGIEYVLVPVIGIVVLVYGIAGGLSAAYFTDLVQGLCIIVLSIILIPFGLEALVERFGSGEGTPSLERCREGFEILHQQLPREYFEVVGSGSSSEFPLHRLIAVVILNLVGIVVQPHFIATGGGSAKTETTARIGLVTGNFLKRFCTVGWVVTGLIALALYADSPELAGDPDRAWGVASRELLGPGLTGLMLACLLAALMSSIDTYMIVGSGLVVRNFYVPYLSPEAGEKECLRVARLTGAIVVGGAVLISLTMMDVFGQLQLTWIVPVLFAAVFWVGMFWRRATTWAAWVTVFACASAFFILPSTLPSLYPGLASDSAYHTQNEVERITTTRQAAPTDVQRRAARRKLWSEKRAAVEELPVNERGFALDAIGPEPAVLANGDPLEETQLLGGKAVFWSKGVVAVDAEGQATEVARVPLGDPTTLEGGGTRQVLVWPEGTRLEGRGDFRLDFLVYPLLGIDLSKCSNALLATLELPVKIVLPFLLMILVSLVTPRNRKESLDRYYAKMKTPVDPDPARDRSALETAFQNPEALEEKKLFPGSSLEFGRPNAVDIVGFVVSVLVCVGIIGLAMWIVSIGS